MHKWMHKMMIRRQPFGKFPFPHFPRIFGHKSSFLLPKSHRAFFAAEAASCVLSIHSA
jgi:hypothetical protein